MSIGLVGLCVALAVYVAGAIAIGAQRRARGLSDWLFAALAWPLVAGAMLWALRRR